MASRIPSATLLAGLLSSGLLASCAPERTLPTAKDTDPEVQHQGQAWLDSMVLSVRSEIEAARGLTFKEAVHATSVSRGSCDSLMQALFGMNGSGYASDPSWAMSERTIVVLGMADSMGQWSAAQSAFDAGTIQGFYQSSNKTLYVFDDGSVEDRTSMVIHEMVHVLQDQNHGLGAITARSREADEYIAAQFLMEGEADYLSMSVSAGNTGALSMDSLVDAGRPSIDVIASGLESWARENRLPLSMVIPQMMPYYLGTHLVSTRRVRSGWNGIDSLYVNRLRTTRTALHPLLKDSVQDWNPGACPAVGGRLRPLETGRLGALYLGSIVMGSLDPSQNLHALTDEWRGDRFWTFHGDSGSALLWRSSWKDAGAAKAFARSWWSSRSVRRASWGTTQFLTVRDSFKTASNADSSRSVLVRVRGNDVVVAEGFSTAEARQLAEGLFALPRRTVFAARTPGATSFGNGDWMPPRSPIPFPTPRIPGLLR